jgi:cytochrome c556
MVFTTLRAARRALSPGREERMLRTVTAVAVVALGATALIAQTDPIKARKDLMEGNGRQARLGSEMVQAKRPFNLDDAKKVFATFQEAGEKAPALFPEGSNSGDTAALPAVWENKTDFDARLAKLASDSKAAIEATKDLDTFKAQFTEVVKNCGGCHQVYRKKQT